MSDLYVFNSSHNVVLIDTKGFVKTMDFKFEDTKSPDKFIEIAVATKPIKVEFKFNNKEIAESVFKKLRFDFYETKYGRHFYREAWGQP